MLANLGNNFKIFLTIVILWVLFMFFFSRSSGDAVLKNLASEKDTAYTETVKGILAEYNKSVVVETQKQLKIVLASNDTLKKLLSKFKFTTNTIVSKTETRIEKDTIPFFDTIPCSFSPLPVVQKNTNFSMFGKVNKSGLIIDSLSIRNKQSIVLGEVKKNIWGKTEQGIYIVNSNPLIKTEAIQNLTIVHKKRLIERPSFWLGIGALTGVITSKTILK